MDLRTVREADIKKGTRVILRADLDVGVGQGKIEDDFRIRAGLPTIRYLLRQRARIRMVGYLGRPQGKRESALSLEPVARMIGSLLKRKVLFVPDPFSKESMGKYGDSPDIVFFENIRFWAEEAQNSISFARRLARWGDCYVNDAFASAHRVEASLVAITKLVPSYAGLRMGKEIAALEKIISSPRRPLTVVLGGAKIETKLPLMKRFLKDADCVLMGGALANTALALLGNPVGKSRIDARSAVSRSLLAHKKLHFPSDVIAARSLAAGAGHRACAVAQVRPDEYIVDIGPDTQRHFSAMIVGAKTVAWNGPMGLAEIPAYAKGTKALAAAAAKSGAFAVVGGGDTIAVLRRLGALAGFSHVSTGGGAMLAFLAGEKLPALDALKK